MVLCISSFRVSVSSNETDVSLVVAIEFTESSSRQLRQFRTRRTPQGRKRPPLVIGRPVPRQRSLPCRDTRENRRTARRRLARPSQDDAPIRWTTGTRVRPALAVNVPPPRRFQHNEGICRWMLTGEPSGDGLDFVGDGVGFDVFDCVFAISTGISSMETLSGLCC